MSASEPINPTFLRTLEFVADALFVESVKDTPQMSPEYIKGKILQRRYEIQYISDVANLEDGCYSEASLIAKEHYQEFSNYKKSEIRRMIEEETQ